MKKLLIQANNLDTVIDVFMYIHNHPSCQKEELADYCGFSLRQADYYTNACKYLDLIDDEWNMTPVAKDIFKNHIAEVTERVYEQIITDDLMGKVFARMILLPEDDISSYAMKLTEDYFPGYSDAVYKRRSDNIVKWCRIVIKHINSK